MRSRDLARCAIALMLLAAATPAGADITARTQPPTFTQEELLIIERNTSLRSILDEDPWTVRRFLDLLADADDDPPADADDDADNTALLEFDAAGDPDLDKLQRASPEAAHDLLQIIKEAAGGGQGTVKQGTAK